jgi:hypothetical protein
VKWLMARWRRGVLLGFIYGGVWPDDLAWWIDLLVAAPLVVLLLWADIREEKACASKETPS